MNEPRQNSDKKDNKNNTNKTICPLQVAKWANENGLVGKDQVENMEKFMNGTIDYATMRSLCG